RAEDLLRRASNALLNERGIPHDGHCLRISPPPGHLVLGSVLADQLVAADLSADTGQLHGLPPTLLVARAGQQLAHLQLSGMEPAQPFRCRAADRDRYASPAEGPGAG